MAREYWIGRGKVQVKVSADLAAMIDRLLSDTAPLVRDALEEEARRIYTEARVKWPVATGKSRDALEWGLRIPDPTVLEAFVMNPVDYAWFIREKWPHNKKRVANELLIKPVRRAGRRLARRLATDLKALATKGGR